MTAGELVLVRHAEAWCNVHDVVGGPLGCRGLTDRGHDQARRVAGRLAAGAGRVDVLYSSPRRRAVETARPVAEALGVPVHVDEELREHDLGPADGHPRSALSADAGGNPFLAPWRPLVPGAESWAQHRSRVERALLRLARSHPGRRLLLVCHGETLNAAYHVFFGLPEGWPGPLPVSVENAAVVRWREGPWDVHRPDLGTRWHLQVDDGGW